MKISYLITSFLILFCNLLSAQHQVLKLQTAKMVNPIGLDIINPTFSWQLETPERGFQQSAYQIIIASSEAAILKDSADIWDSKKVSSNQSSGIVFPGSSLKSKKRYLWKVKVWDQNGKASSYSNHAFWEMGLLNKEDWKGNWISAPRILDWATFAGKRETDNVDEVFSAAPMFRKSFTTKRKVKSARLYISGLGYNISYLNGKKISNHILDPAFTRYDKTVLYNSFDVSSLLHEGENVMGVVLGNGWYNMFTRSVWGFDQASWRNMPTFIAQLEIVYEDGSNGLIISDDSWKVAPGPIYFNSIFQGEFYDARKEIPGWNKPAFQDTSWMEVLKVSGPLGEKKAQLIQPIRETAELSPKSVTEVGKGKYVFDLGRNIAGYARFKIQAPAGTIITLLYGERLTSTGQVDQEHIAMYSKDKPFHTDKYTCKGEGLEEWSPSFVYHGFQYIEVHGLSTKPGLDFLKGVLVHTDLESAGKFECSNELFNKIQSNTRNSYLNNFHGYPTDCPQREKNGWTGDAHLAAEMGLYNFKSQQAYQKWLMDIVDEQRPSGEIPGIVPTAGWGYFFGNGPAWDSAFMLIPWYLYQYNGDEETLKKLYPHLKRYVKFLKTKANSEHIVSWGLGDWCPSDTKTPVEITSTAYYYIDVLTLSKISGLLKHTSDEKEYYALAETIKKAFNKRFYKGNGIYGNGSQTSLACAIYQGLAGENMEATVGALVEAVKQKDYHLDCGILGAKYLLHALSDHGHTDIAYRIVNQRTFPGWGYWVTQGATTLWEQWNGTASRNHIMFGDVSAWFYKALGGIAPAKDGAGYKKIILKPYFKSELTWVKANHESSYGTIQSNWENKNGTIIYTIEIPANTSAMVHLPIIAGKKIYENNKVIFNGNKHVKLVERKIDEFVFEVKSGNYSFKIK
jgi:alpha-L-rhamnosidase